MIPAEDKRVEYWYVDPTVSLWRCTKLSPMNIDGNRASELKMLIIHDDVEEIGESDSGQHVHYGCPNCGYKYWVDLGD